MVICPDGGRCVDATCSPDRRICTRYKRCREISWHGQTLDRLTEPQLRDALAEIIGKLETATQIADARQEKRFVYDRTGS